MTSSDQAILLIRKADEDIHVLDMLVGDSATADELWGFHAQQAVEKLLKALLAEGQVRLPFTHRLLDLADLLSDAGKDIPSEFEGLLDLTPYAVEFRYSSLPADVCDRLDRASILAAIVRLRAYVCGIVGLGGPSHQS